MPVDMAVLDEFAEKLAALRRWVREAKPPYQGADAYDSAPVPEAELGRAEREFGVTLPAEFRAFLTRIGGGRAWPGNLILSAPWGLTPASRAPFSLSAPLLGLDAPEVKGLPADAQWEKYGGLLEVWNGVPKGAGVLQFCGYGCGIDAVLILNGPFAGRVWVVAGDAAYYGPFGGAEGLHERAEGPPQRDYPFLEWYADWLDGQLLTAAGSGLAVSALGRFRRSDP